MSGLSALPNPPRRRRLRALHPLTHQSAASKLAGREFVHGDYAYTSSVREYGPWKQAWDQPRSSGDRKFGFDIPLSADNPVNTPPFYVFFPV